METRHKTFSQKTLIRVWNWDIRFSYYFLCLFCYSCTEQSEPSDVYAQCLRLKPLTQAKHPVRPGEWRDSYTEVHEPYQAYIRRNPTSATDQRFVLYVVQLGAFDSLGKKILAQAKDYLHAFYQIEVKELPPLALNSIAKAYTRTNTFGLQIKTGVILDSLLPSLLPDDAFALIAFSLHDLYPQDDWNFVFGQASLERRVGVWSLARLGDYRQSDAIYSRCVQRTLNVAVHETGHMFGIHHCVPNECCMNGSNSLAESDRQVPWLCWECLAKVCTNRNIQPATHLEALLKFHRNNTHDSTQINYYIKALHMLKP